MEETNVYFNPGDVVQVRQNISNKPRMMVIRKVTSIFKHDPSKNEDKKSTLKGIKCMWYGTDGTPHEYIFSTKDLELVKK